LSSRFSGGSGSAGGSYTLPTASGSTLGGIKVGSGLAIDGSGVLSPAAQPALVKLDEVLVGSGGAASIAFSSIVQTYRSLRVVLMGRCDAAVAYRTISLQLNADTGSNYDWELTYAYDSASGGVEQVAGVSLLAAELVAGSGPAGAADCAEILLPHYAQTTFHKTMLSQCTVKKGSTTGTLVYEAVAGWWHSTAAISSILLFPNSGNFAQGTLCSLYGMT
jgi:hypothetical protein